MVTLEPCRTGMVPNKPASYLLMKIFTVQWSSTWQIHDVNLQRCNGIYHVMKITMDIIVTPHRGRKEWTACRTVWQKRIVHNTSHIWTQHGIFDGISVFHGTVGFPTQKIIRIPLDFVNTWYPKSIPCITPLGIWTHRIGPWNCLIFCALIPFGTSFLSLLKICHHCNNFNDCIIGTIPPILLPILYHHTSHQFKSVWIHYHHRSHQFKDGWIPLISIPHHRTNHQYHQYVTTNLLALIYYHPYNWYVTTNTTVRATNTTLIHYH